jgi:prepilin-type N-terminal cleavage/methylation domain-containing protein
LRKELNVSRIYSDFTKGKRGFSRLTGFTVIEMMTVLAVLAIITSFAIPSYMTLLDKRRVTSGAVQMASFLSSAQMESVKRGEQISVNYNMTSTDIWCLGLISGNASCDCRVAVDESNACLIDGQLRVFSHDSINNPAIMNNISGGARGSLLIRCADYWSIIPTRSRQRWCPLKISMR